MITAGQMDDKRPFCNVLMNVSTTGGPGSAPCYRLAWYDHFVINSPDMCCSSTGAKQAPFFGVSENQNYVGCLCIPVPVGIQSSTATIELI